MKKKIKVAYFPKAIKFATPLIFVAALYLAFNQYYLWALVLFLAVVAILTTNYVTEIDTQNKRYRDYLYFLGFFLNHEENKFKAADRIIITKGNHAHMANTRSRSRQVDWSDYTATLIFDDLQQLDLLTRNDKEELIKGLKEFSETLNVGIEDRTLLLDCVASEPEMASN